MTPFETLRRAFRKPVNLEGVQCSILNIGVQWVGGDRRMHLFLVVHEPEKLERWIKERAKEEADACPGCGEEGAFHSGGECVR